MPLRPFRDLTDPDEKRREIVWIAISFIVILASLLAVVLVFGYQPLILGVSYDEVVLLTGLGLLVFCMVLYLGAREREQRLVNRRLVGELQAAVERLDRRLEQLRGLHNTSTELAGSLDIDHILQSVVESLTETVRASQSSLLLLDEKTGHPVYAHHCGAVGLEEDGSASYPGISEWGEGGLDGRDLDEQIDAWNQVRSLICAPLRLRNGLTGVLGARRGDGEELFTADDLRLLTTLANMAAKAIESAHLHAELRDSYFATIRTLVNSLDARDNYTAAHGKRVAGLAVQIAERMGLSEGLIRDIEAFGPLHDVGKIGITDAILLKAGPLSPEERDLCQEHCTIGERIIRPLKPGQHALAMVRSHHELWDGQGYPDGLAGEQIPILARVLQVADCFDAMSSDRPYQSAMSQQEVLAHFRQHSGKRYDSRVVSALTAVLEEEPADGVTRGRDDTSVDQHAWQTRAEAIT